MADAYLKFTYPAEKRDIIIASFCRQFGYSETLFDGTPNTETPGEFATKQILRMIAEVVERDQVGVGVAEAQAAAEVAAKSLALTTLAAVTVETDQS